MESIASLTAASEEFKRLRGTGKAYVGIRHHHRGALIAECLHEPEIAHRKALLLGP